MEEAKQSKGEETRPAGSAAPQDDEADSSEEEIVEPDELYDELEDDTNEKWVQKHIRRGRQTATDAVLSCPCCFTTVCMDCQRHATIKTQFRAMFTVNCTVQTHTTVRPPKASSSAKKKGKKKQGDGSGGGGAEPMEEEGEVLHPVCCQSCGTMVGVMDADEVVHFHNVLESG